MNQWKVVLIPVLIERCAIVESSDLRFSNILASSRSCTDCSSPKACPCQAEVEKYVSIEDLMISSKSVSE